MSKIWTDRTVIYLVRAGDDFTPRSPWDCPNSFTEARVHARNVPLEDARAAVRCSNKTNIDNYATDPEAWDRQWAIAVASPRAKALDSLIRVCSLNRRKRKVQP